MGGDGGFAPLVGLRDDGRDFCFAIGVLEYGFELEAFTFGFFALPIEGVRMENEARGEMERRLRCQGAKPCGES